ncbi:hypothetical protein NHX12_007981 [Muraenolepis orangiensis]|uniref:Uncharacterized protein n=1 Tax=Muraenolepis orangiensis TaxID=630683 RepID=A0A9Q0DKE7_9TELE|nr:hypothetical protein NHX12_007981 [Muraenolepis orangiensis]
MVNWKTLIPKDLLTRSYAGDWAGRRNHPGDPTDSSRTRVRNTDTAPNRYIYIYIYEVHIVRITHLLRWSWCVPTKASFALLLHSEATDPPNELVDFGHVGQTNSSIPDIFMSLNALTEFDRRKTTQIRGMGSAVTPRVSPVAAALGDVKWSSIARPRREGSTGFPR